MTRRSSTLRRKLAIFIAAPLLALGGCSLTDQQLASVWASVLSSGLTTIVTGVLEQTVGTTTTGTTNTGTTNQV